MIESGLKSRFEDYIAAFNADDEELYIQDIDNAHSAEFLYPQLPLIDLPDKIIEKVYYYRWWTLRKQLKSTPHGHIFTEFLPSVGWAGPYNSINGAVGHHLREARWMRDPDGYIKEFISFWLDRIGDSLSYSSWIAYSVEEYLKLHPDSEFDNNCIDKLVSLYNDRVERNMHSCGLFWSDEDRDAMELSISGSGIRPTLNSYMIGNAESISHMAARAGRFDVSKLFAERAGELKEKMDRLLWDGDFYKVIPCSKEDKVPENSRPYVSPDHDVREEIGYIPWYFDIPGADKSIAFRYLTDEKGFSSPFGITTAERSHPRFLFKHPHECLWNGYVWPFATSQTLTGIANHLRRNGEAGITKADYYSLLKQYASMHKIDRGDGKEHLWIDEVMDPITGDWSSRTLLKEDNWNPWRGGYERGKDYNHSTFCDLVLSGLLGIDARDGQLTVDPLIPDDWDWFCVTNLPPYGKSVIFDRTGERYGLGPGIHVI